jgi:two-component system chemotaxis sensor kinase CheA
MMVLRMVPVASCSAASAAWSTTSRATPARPSSFTTDGETTEVDKTVIERLADPLVHLIRNAADHGLETPEERRRRQARAGRIKLSAHQQGGEVIITIRDDGRGIDRDRVRAKAEAQGLISRARH